MTAGMAEGEEGGDEEVEEEDELGGKINYNYLFLNGRCRDG